MRKQQTIPALSDIPVPDTARYEWQVLSDVIANNSTMAGVADMLTERNFTSDYRKAVWNQCVSLFNEGRPFDIAAVSIACGPEIVQHIYSDKEGIDDLGWRYAEEHARILLTASARRSLYEYAIEMLALSQDQMTTDTSIYTRAADGLQKIEPSHVRREVSLIDTLNGIADEIQRKAEDAREGRPNRITSGIDALDEVLYGGMAPGNLVIVAARPSVGKTALMLHMVRRCAASGANAGVFSIEMTADELGTRMLASVSEEYEDENYPGLDNPRRSVITPYKIANGFDSPEDWDSFEKAVGKIDDLPVLINDNARDLRDIVARITVLNKQGKCDVAFIDYLGLISQAQADSKTPLYQVIGQITGTLKATAKSLRIPIVLLCQLNREAAKQNKSPQLYNLRDSGAIEQDADVVLMLNQTPGPKLPDLEVWVRKNRQGEKDFGILMRPNDNYTDFKELCIIQNK